MKFVKLMMFSIVVAASGMGVAQANNSNAGTTLWERTCMLNGEPTMMPPIICRGRGGEVPEQYKYDM